MKIDDKENNPKYALQFADVENLLEVEDSVIKRGGNRAYWARKKQLLKQLYNIDWKSPQDLNPGVIFD